MYGATTPTPLNKPKLKAIINSIKIKSIFFNDLIIVYFMLTF